MDSQAPLPSIVPEAGDLADEARMLGTFAVHMVAAITTIAGATKAYHAWLGHPWSPDAADAAAGAALVGAVAIAAAARLGLLDRRAAIWAGPIMLVAGTGLVTAFELLRPWPPGHVPLGVSWVCPYILVYPFMAPVPRRGWWIALALCPIAAAAALALAVGVGVRPWPDGGTLLWMSLPVLLSVGLAYLPAQDLLRLRELGRTGSYRLTEPLDAGGMGEVWRAEHRLLARPAAVKLIRADGGTSRRDLRRRFRTEAHVTSTLQSPHTVRVYDFGMTDDGRFFYVMELLEGLDLQTLVKRHGPVEAARAVFLVRQACLSLAEAAAHDLVHRDIKPANLMICRLGLQADFLKVLDFGLVGIGADAPTSTGAPLDVERTVVGAVAGTPAYLAPEVAEHGASAATPSADLYGLGCVLYWLLTGQPVFTEQTVDALLEAHRSQAPVPPSSRSELDIPEALDALVLGCLAKDPADRPASATALLDELDAITFARPWTAQHARTWWARHEPGEIGVGHRLSGDPT